VKVCDFGLSRIVEQTLSATMTSCGTPCWTAPEILRNSRYTEKADVYSFGILLWEIVTREDPYKGMPPFQVVFAVGTQKIRPKIPVSCPPCWAELITQCWAEDPEMRPSFVELLQSFAEFPDIVDYEDDIPEKNEPKGKEPSIELIEAAEGCSPKQNSRHKDEI